MKYFAVGTRSRPEWVRPLTTLNLHRRQQDPDQFGLTG
jgi:hypothetical protein